MEEFFSIEAKAIMHKVGGSLTIFEFLTNFNSFKIIKTQN
jgi:hypothetical protein